MEGEPQEEATLFPTTVGEKLRAAREAQGIDLADIAQRTRIPLRHLEAIERGNYSLLPSITYAVGFAKAYARAVDVDEVAIARDVRSELGTAPERPAPMPSYEMRDSTRSPPSALVWIGLVVAVLVLVGAGLWYGTDLFRGAPAPENLSLVEPTPTPTPTPSATPVGGGQVSLIALDSVWLRVSDATGKTLFEKQMATGERYDVPADADHPKVKTARADKIQVTVNGSNVAPLGPPEQAIEVEVSAEALLSRGTTDATPTPVPAAVSTPAPAARRPAARPTTPPAATPVPSPSPTQTPAG